MEELAQAIEKLILAYEEETGSTVQVVRWGIGVNTVENHGGNLSDGSYTLTWADENERYVSVEVLPV